MAAPKVITADKEIGQYMRATMYNELKDVINDHADLLDGLLDDLSEESLTQLELTDNHSVTALTKDYTLLLFTTGASNLTCTFTAPEVEVPYRVYKVDTGAGTVIIEDADRVTIETLRFQGEYLDVYFVNADNYIIF
jgi:hypothetical protein